MAAAAVAKDSDVQIFKEDQVKINTFAKKNHKMQVRSGVECQDCSM